MEICEEIVEARMKNALKKPQPIVDVEHLPKDKIKRKEKDGYEWCRFDIIRNQGNHIMQKDDHCWSFRYEEWWNSS